MILPGHTDNHWAEYLEAMRRLETQVKLVAWHTKECARHTEEVANQVDVVVTKVRSILWR